jgi:hypothetical protein
MFVHLIRMVGLRDTVVILVQAPRGPYVQFGEVFYKPRGLVVGGTSLGREREQVPSLECGEELIMLLGEYFYRFRCAVAPLCVPVFFHLL